MPLIDVRRLPSVALSFMNDDHHLEACLLNDVAETLDEHVAGRASAGDVLACWDALLAHTREHFAREEAAMEDSAFPPAALHQAEHDRVLGDMEAEAADFRRTGDAARLRSFATETVPAWLVTHIESMDHVTARWVTARAA